MVKKEKSKGIHIFGIIVISLITLFAACFSYINEPIGDDVLCYFDGALTYYLDDITSNLGNRLSNLGQVVKELGFVYQYWSGRMSGYTFEFIGKLMPKSLQAVLTALIFTSNIFLALRIVYGKRRKVLEHPLAFGILFLVMYWYRSECYYTYMWTMVSIYSFAVFLSLLYYNFSENSTLGGKTSDISTSNRTTCGVIS